MDYVNLPGEAASQSHPLPFYLAMEEYLLEQMDANAPDRFFMWQVDPTVIFGRNQIGSREVDLDYCRRNGIEVYRRKSGGGCVFADRSNIMMSYVTRRKTPVAGTFLRYTSMVTAMLRTLGIDATANTRNDIAIDGLKVSGNAFYHTPRGSIVHGTMLFDSDMKHMSNALTPSAQKLMAKGVRSVSSHVTVLSRYTGLTIEEFKQHARHCMCGSEMTLSEADVAAIERLSAPYFTDRWRFGFDSRESGATARRVEGVGEFIVDVRLNAATGLIAAIDIAGDFFMTADIDALLIAPLIGRHPEEAALREALRGTDVGEIIAGLSNEQFINLLIS